MKRERKQYTAEEKVAILRRHFLEKVPVSDLCEELNLQPTVFYRWQKEFYASHDASIDVDTEDMEINGMIDASGNIPGFRNAFLNDVAVGKV
jgi:transposase-like protein